MCSGNVAQDISTSDNTVIRCCNYRGPVGLRVIDSERYRFAETNIFNNAVVIEYKRHRGQIAACLKSQSDYRMAVSVQSTFESAYGCKGFGQFNVVGQDKGAAWCLSVCSQKLEIGGV